MRARTASWHQIAQPCHVLIIGGGITGAGILHEAAHRGLTAILVERGDFASGTSSRSSKLVHGGLRYIKEGKIGLTRESVLEREALLAQAPGLVDPLSFLMPHYPGGKPGPALLGIGLAIYDLLAWDWKHRYVDAAEALRLAPPLRREGLTGAHIYTDATTDDARLVLRLLQEAQDAGAVAINYAEVTQLGQRDGLVAQASVIDRVGGEQVTLNARVIVNATGASADALRVNVGAAPALRPLRGSHLLLPDWRLPLAQAVAFSHPRDGRPVFAYPWSGITLVGTTDLDHTGNLRDEPSISQPELTYLLEALADHFPDSAITRDDVVSTYAGVRPVVASGAADPSKESRDQLLLEERGLITITGGKLTTFRPMAIAALRAAMRHLPTHTMRGAPATFRHATVSDARGLSSTATRRLAGRYGEHAQAVIDGANEGELEPIGGSDTLWAELRYAAEHEAVVHLDDLLLRRTRIGLLQRDGGVALLPRIRACCAAALGWDDARWNDETQAYATLWQRHYGVPHA